MPAPVRRRARGGRGAAAMAARRRSVAADAIDLESHHEAASARAESPPAIAYSMLTRRIVVRSRRGTESATDSAGASTPAERLAMMAVLTRNAWAFADAAADSAARSAPDDDARSRLPRHPL